MNSYYFPKYIWINIKTYILPKYMWNIPNILKFNKILLNLPKLQPNSNPCMLIFRYYIGNFSFVKYYFTVKGIHIIAYEFEGLKDNLDLSLNKLRFNYMDQLFIHNPKLFTKI